MFVTNNIFTFDIIIRSRTKKISIYFAKLTIIYLHELFFERVELDINSSVSVIERDEVSRSLYSIDKFNLIIKRERFRSDRNNQKFSLITFDVGRFYDGNTVVDDFIDILTSRIRISDDVGWFDSRRIAVLLPETKLTDAQKLAHSVCKTIAVSTPPPPCTVYMYPSLKWMDGDSYTEPSCPQENVHEKIVTGHRLPVWKRTMDIFGSLVGLIVLSPVLLLIALFIKVVSPGPVFFRQDRVGRSGKVFRFLKFRSMKVNNDVTVHRKYLKDLINGDSNGDEAMTKLDNNSVYIPFGKILRKTCLDELPQLINVLRGEMSLIGPRPCIPYEAEEYLRWHSRRFDITPGMTGLWQVSGKNKTTFKEMIRLDIKYSVERSFLLDTIILLKTPLVVLSQSLGDFGKIKRVGSAEKEKIMSATDKDKIMSAVEIA